jgi:hypothetical protein
MDFLSALFNSGESTCFAKHTQGTSVFDAFDPPGWAVFFSINPLVDRRLDDNVTAFRNFLIELDSGALDEQRRLVEASDLPWNTCVYSGGKSHHYIVTLEDALPDEQTYRDYAARIHQLLELKGVHADPSTKNPSRFSRLPGRTRPDTGLEQELVAVRGNICRRQLDGWLAELPAETKARKPGRNWRPIETIAPATQRLLVFGLPDSLRYNAIRDATFNLCGAGWSPERIADAIIRATDWRRHADVTPDEIRDHVNNAFDWKLKKDARLSKIDAKGG